MPTLMYTNEWHGLNHAIVYEKMEGDLAYINTFSIAGHTWAVYRNSKPNKKKKHKDYMMLCQDRYSGSWHVSGRTKKEMEKERKQTAAWCRHCDEVIFSQHVHDYRKCGCGKTMIDGGKDYIRTSSPSNLVEIDLIDLTISAKGKIYPLTLNEKDILQSKRTVKNEKRSDSKVRLRAQNKSKPRKT